MQSVPAVWYLEWQCLSVPTDCCGNRLLTSSLKRQYGMRNQGRHKIAEMSASADGTLSCMATTAASFQHFQRKPVEAAALSRLGDLADE